MSFHGADSPAQASAFVVPLDRGETPKPRKPIEKRAFLRSENRSPNFAFPGRGAPAVDTCGDSPTASSHLLFS